MIVKFLATLVALIAMSGVSRAAESPDPHPLPRFAPPRQEFDSTVHSGMGPTRECRQLFKPPRTAMPAKALANGFDQWGKQSNYSKRKLDRLFKIEESLPVDQVTYLRYVHVSDPNINAHIRIFAGETAEGESVTLVMERKDRTLKLEKGKRNFELGVLTKTEGLGDVAGPLLGEVVKFLSAEVSDYHYDVFIWATARPAQARLYEPLGLKPTGLKTKDGMLVLKGTLLELERARSAKSNDELALMTRDEYLRIRDDSKVTSGHIREWYRLFWQNEEKLATDPDGEKNQYELQATMRAAQIKSNWLFDVGGGEIEGYNRMKAEWGQDGTRYLRKAAALLVIADRTELGLGTSPALRRIAYYNLDYRYGYRFNHYYTVAYGQALSSIGGFGRRITRTITTMNAYYDSFETNLQSRQRQMDEDREAADKSLSEPWQNLSRSHAVVPSEAGH